MFDFLVPIFVVGFCMACLYGLFELYARRRERMAIIEKLSGNLSPDDLKEQLGRLSPIRLKLSFSALKAGSMLIGIGLGLLTGFALNLCVLTDNSVPNFYEMVGVAYGASVLLFGGIGLIVAFVIETRMARKNR